MSAKVSRQCRSCNEPMFHSLVNEDCTRPVNMWKCLNRTCKLYNMRYALTSLKQPLPERFLWATEQEKTTFSNGREKKLKESFKVVPQIGRYSGLVGKDPGASSSASQVDKDSEPGHPCSCSSGTEVVHLQNELAALKQEHEVIKDQLEHFEIRDKFHAQQRERLQEMLRLARQSACDDSSPCGDPGSADSLTNVHLAKRVALLTAENNKLLKENARLKLQCQGPAVAVEAAVTTELERVGNKRMKMAIEETYCVPAIESSAAEVKEEPIEDEQRESPLTTRSHTVVCKHCGSECISLNDEAKIFWRCLDGRCSKLNMVNSVTD